MVVGRALLVSFIFVLFVVRGVGVGVSCIVVESYLCCGVFVECRLLLFIVVTLVGRFAIFSGGVVDDVRTFGF